MTPNENTQAEREDILQDLHNELYRAQTTDNPVVLLEAVGRARLLLSRYRAALSAPPAAECDHEWVSARNKYITSGEICAKLCGAIRTEGSATPVAAVAQPVADDLLKLAVQCMNEVDDREEGPRVIMGLKTLARFAEVLQATRKGTP